ncbi:protein translocase subunit SecD [candidate division WOR-3 bacterium JGI_Cruoil_03_51_56]|uniref:Protein translocase subunit SecD n=1 Tax=candidate division WOR-3 bacterium JGI_Cruoil_03_51_56 TaxID=1973747 RepID=A0A235BT44_UNCW3|nr:MAG: protein translocase subunit SecD [candidate division WOR-3 bacterium JGI_Cruoil_03_51_56]
MKGAKVKFGMLVVAIALAIWSLYPTYRLYFRMPKYKRAVEAKLSRATNHDDSLKVQLELVRLQKETSKLHKSSLHLGLDLVGGMHLVLEVDKSKLTKEEARDAGDRALEVIRNRVDQFGVFEPIIQKVGRDRVLVQLPGVDRERAKTLIGQTAQLQFQLVADERSTYDALKTISDKLEASPSTDTTAGSDTLKTLAGLDTSSEDTGWTGQVEEEEAGSFMGYIQTIGGDFGVDDADYPEFHRLLENGRPHWPKDYVFLFGSLEPFEGRDVRRLYLLKAVPELRGSAIKDARPSPYRGSDPSLSNTWIVSLKLARRDAAVFARVTGRNIGRRLAIVLDNIVQSAPVIQSRIPDGNAMITTNEVNPDEARDLAIVLRSGALPAPVNIVEERSVGASLGNDSIRRGIQAGVIGALAVLLFMIIYYAAGGVLADFALVFNVFFLLAVLAGLHATLTLPGMAGIALTIGMAVDANVLVFERIREELRAGKTTMAAVDTGYDRAFVTIVDANVTTVITAIALYFIGSGAVRGFAITLITGLIINVITAVFLTRFIFDWYLSRFEVKKLRI